MKRKIRIILSENGENEEILTAQCLRVPVCIVRWIYGAHARLLLLTPGRKICGIEVCEQKNGGVANEQ